MQTRCVVLLGPPGSGKGTQQACLVSLGFREIETGRSLREAATKDQELAQILQNGQLVNDERVATLLQSELEVLTYQDQRVVIDGFFRTSKQVPIGLSILRYCGYYSDDCAFVLLEGENEEFFRRQVERHNQQVKEIAKFYNMEPGVIQDLRRNLTPQILKNWPRLKEIRTDADPASIQSRMETYTAHIGGIIEELNKAEQRIVHINATLPAPEVFKSLIQALELKAAIV